MKGISIDSDGLIPQIESYHLGGIKTIAGRLTFYVGFFNLVLIVPTAYNSVPTLQQWFPNVFAFGGVVTVLLAIAAIVELGVVYPSQLKFAKSQASKNERDPIYREVKRLHERLDDWDSEQQVTVPDGCGCVEIWEHMSDQRRRR